MFCLLWIVIRSIGTFLLLPVAVFGFLHRTCPHYILFKMYLFLFPLSNKHRKMTGIVSGILVYRLPSEDQVVCLHFLQSIL